MGASLKVHYFAIYKVSALQIEQQVRNFFNLAQSLHRAQLFKKFVLRR